MITREGQVIAINIRRGAPCAASWEATDDLLGMDAETAAIQYGLQVQFFCSADPAGWDPIYGKSPVHFAADVHTAAFRKGCREA